MLILSILLLLHTFIESQLLQNETSAPQKFHRDEGYGPEFSAQNKPAGRSLQLRLLLLNQPPAQPERLGDGVVRRLKADAN